MGYRKLLVGLADPRTAPRVLAAAGALAVEHEAHLLVVHVVPRGLTHENGTPVADVVERLEAVYAAYRDDAAFSSEWRVIDDDVLSVAGTLVELGNACDAVVLGQRHAREAGRPTRHLGEHVAGVTARPVLLLPESADATFSARRVLLAWDGSALATRAAFDARPLLERATHVRVHRFDASPDERRYGSGAAEAFAATLSRHDVPVSLTRSDASRLEIGAEIIALAAEEAADLVVMGCRVHGRVRQFLLGDTTRHVFANAVRPLLMGG